jgi:AcrR family transcriptional regulator
LIAAAAGEFRTAGYFGTDSNVIARAAGYAAGTFYKHFVDKRAVFLAVYVDWVTSLWRDIKELVESDLSHAEAAERLIDVVLANHRTWRVFRASLRALLATDAVVRRYHRASRRRQLQMMRELMSDPGDSSDALGMLITERIADALADGEAEAIGLSRQVARDYLIDELAQTFKRRRRV